MLRACAPLLAIAAALALARSARADAVADITALVRNHVATLASGDDAAYAATLAPGARLIAPYGFESHSRARDVYYDTVGATATHQVGTVTVAADPATHTAWFEAAFTSTLRWDDGVGHKTTTHANLRFGGLAIDDHGWKLAGIVYVMPTPDARLLHADVRKPHVGAPTLAGDAGLAAAVAAWFPGKLAAARTTAARAAATGTAPDEVALTAAAAGKLAAGWDKLKLAVAGVDASVYAGGKIGFAIVDVEFPIKGGMAPLTLGVVAVKDGDVWRWSAVIFTVGFTR